MSKRISKERKKMIERVPPKIDRKSVRFLTY